MRLPPAKSAMQLKSVLRRAFWGVAALWAIVLCASYARNLWRARKEQWSATPSALSRMRDTSVTEVGGASIALLSRDSATVVLIATAECAACRSAVPLLADAYRQALQSGAATRLVVGSETRPAAQFGRLLPSGLPVIADSALILIRRLGARTVPALMVFAPSREVVARWSGATRGLPDSIQLLGRRLAQANR